MATTHAILVHPGNQQQLEAWDGSEGDFWAANADRFDRAVGRYQRPLLDAAGLRPADRVLDVGCGNGRTSLDAASRVGDGAVLGVDLSAAMLRTARARAEAGGLSNVRFEQADAQVHEFEANSFDVVLSHTGGTFFSDPVAAWTAIGRALRREGRVATLAWQPIPDNEWISEIGTALSDGRPIPLPPPGVPGPFAFGDPDTARHALTAAGFTAIALRSLTEPMCFGDDADDACAFILGVSGWMLDGLDGEGRARALAALRRTVEAHTGVGGVEFGSAMWLITARRDG